MSQNDIVHSFLLSGRSLTQMEASERWGISRLASRINAIKPRMTIDDQYIRVPNRHGDLVRIKEYWMHRG